MTTYFWVISMKFFLLNFSLTLAAEKLALPLYLSSSLGRPYTNLEEAEAVLQKKTAVPRELFVDVTTT